MSFAAVSTIPLRDSRLKISLLTLALALLLPAPALASCSASGSPPVTTCTSSAGITVSGVYAASEGSSNVVSGLTSVTNISLTFTGLDVTNLNDVAIVLVPPSGSGLTPLDLLSGVCGYGSGQIGNSTFTLADTGSGTDNNSGMMSGIGLGTCPATFSGTYLPTDYFPGQDTFNSPGPSTYNSGGPNPSVDGSGIYNFNSFGENGSVMNGTWTLYIANQNSSAEYANPSGSLGSWSLSFTGSASTATTTSISANPNGLTSTVYTSSNVGGQATTATSVTLTATVSPNPGGGSVTFYDSTNSSPGAGTVLASGVLLSRGQASKVVTFTGAEEGSRSISATYNPASGYLGSTTPANSEATVLTVNYPYNPSGATYCNGPVTVSDNPSNVGGTGGFPYPSQLILGGISGTIEDVTVTLNGLQTQDPNFNGFMLQAPNGAGYEFMSWADGNGPGGDPASLTNTTVWLADGGSGLLQTASQGNNGQQTCSSSSPCKPTDDYVQIDPLYDDTFPSPASPFTAPTSVGKAYPTGSATFTSEFGGAAANGKWLLYLNNWLSENPSNNSSIPYGQVGSWCMNFTMQSGADATTTTVSASPNPVSITSGATASATFTATVSDSSNSNTTVNGGTVTFVDGATTLGSSSVSNGKATVTASLTEGTHQVVASFSGTNNTSPEFGISTGTLDLRVNNATTNPASGSGAGPFSFCNSGSITAPAAGYDYGAALPYPSNIVVANLPGTVKATTVTLNDFTTRDQGDLMSLLVGPGGNNLDFFSLTGSNVGTAPSAFNLTFQDGASAISGNLTGGGPYEPSSKNTSIAYPQCAQNATLCGNQDVGPPLGSSSTFTPANKATTAGSGILGNAGASGVFGGGTGSTYNGNGIWSLYIDDGGPTGEGEDTSLTGGWCVNLTVNLPSISLTAQSPSTLAQGLSGSFPVTITNLGAGDIGDPTQTAANAMVVTDTLPTGLTYSSFTGTDWSCSASGQTVTCKNQDTVAPTADYLPLSISVSVSNTAFGDIGNNTVSISDAEAANTPSPSSASVTIDVPPSINSTSSTTFTVGSSGTLSVTTAAATYPTASFSESGVLPIGVTLTDNGNGTATLAGNPAAGTGGAYPIVITASNGISPNATQDFTLTVDQAPAITSAPGATFAVGSAGSFIFISATGAYPAATFSETGNLPTGVTLSSGGFLSGTPAAGAGGSYPIVVTASNGVSPSATQDFTLTVNQSPAITSAAATTFTVGSSGSFTATASGNPAPTFSESGVLPTGVTFSSGGALSGTPSAGTGGTYPLTINASNGIGVNATQSFTLTVNQAPAITNASSTTFAVNSTGSFIFISATGTYPAAAFSETGNLPTGVTLSSGGVLSGTPAAGTGGSYPIVVTASNGVSPNATQDFTLYVDQAPGISGASSFTFMVGGTGAYLVFGSGYPTPSFSETGALPAGITFADQGNGRAQLSGSPAAGTGGSYPISITASNGISPNAMQNYTLTVNQDVAFTNTAGATFEVGTAGSFTVTTTGYPAPSFSSTSTLPSGVTFADNGNGTATLSGTPSAGTQGTYPITITASNTFSTPSQSFTLTVIPPQYQLTTAANPAAGGVVTPTSGNIYSQGTVVPLEATPATGYTFVGWTSAADPVASANSASTTITMNGPESVTAQFAPNLVVNTVNDDAGSAGNCSVQPTPGTTTNLDTCSLRDALTLAGNDGAGSISFDSTAFSSAETITLTTGNTLNIPSNTTITGPTSGAGATLTNLVTVAGGGSGSNFPVFNVNSSATSAKIANLIITNGYSSTSAAGGIVNGYQSALTVMNSTVNGNSDPASAGGIFNDYGATLSVIDSTISGNFGAAIINESGGTVTISSSTISGNSGTGIANGGLAVTVIGSTISGNTAGYSGGGINTSGGTVTLANTIVAGNIATTSPDIYGAYTDNGGNIVGGVNGVTASNVNLAPLFIYGGPTQTMLPLPGSPAICAINVTNPSSVTGTDQRGFPPTTTYSITTCQDSGAVQTNYALTFTTQPPSNPIGNLPISPSPVVQLTESGVPAAAAANSVTMTDSANLLTGTTLENLAAGSATFNNLIIPSPTSNDILTATMPLTLTMNLTATATVGVTVVPSPSVLYSPAPNVGTALGSSGVLFQWTSGTSATKYELILGTTGVGSSNLYNSGEITALSATANTLPADGVTVFARLYSLVSGAWHLADYTYIEGGTLTAATLSPAANTVLTASQAFSWANGAGPTDYELYLGTTGVGSYDLYSSGVTTATSETVTLPTYGVKVYARLFQRINGVWQSADTTYTEGGSITAATLSPATNTVLTASQAFSWANGNGPSEYQLYLGTTGVGSFNLYNSGIITATSATVTLPTNGVKVFARFFQRINGVWQSADTTYTEGGSLTLASLSPTANTVLTASQVFSWSNGAGPSEYELYLGTTGVGSSNLYNSGITTATSEAVTLPTNGVKVYARLFQRVNGVWQSADTTYTEAP